MIVRKNAAGCNLSCVKPAAFLWAIIRCCVWMINLPNPLTHVHSAICVPVTTKGVLLNLLASSDK